MPQDQTTPAPRELRDRVLIELDDWLGAAKLRSLDHVQRRAIAEAIAHSAAAARDLTEIAAVMRGEQHADPARRFTADDLREIAGAAAEAAAQQLGGDAESAGAAAREFVRNLEAEGSLDQTPAAP